MLPRSAPYKCAVVDDSDLDRLTIQAHIKRQPELELVASFANPVDALRQISEHPVDILFLDVDTPVMKGTELRRKLDEVPACVFVTAHPDYAVDAFDLHALDYILKPVQSERFAVAMDRIRAFFDVRMKAELFEHALGSDEMFIKEGRERFKIRLRDILYLEALKDYTRVVTATRKYCVLGSIMNVMRDPAFSSFIRVHRSYAVQKHYITRVDTNHVYLDNIEVPMGRVYRPDVEQALRTKIGSNVQQRLG